MKELSTKESMGLDAWQGESRGMAMAHQHLDLELNYILKGTMRYLVGGRIVELPQHQLCLLWGGVPHQMIRNPEPVEAIWVTIPLADILRWSLPETLTRPLLATGFIADPAPHPGDRAQLQQWVEDLSEPGSAEIVLLEIEARLRRLARRLSQNQAPHNTATHSDRSLIAVEAMAHFITQRFQDEIHMKEIAAQAYLHPNYAMTLFRQHTGLTLSQYLTLQRISHAQQLLLTTDIAIAEIALRSGFGSVSRFYEAFRQQTKTTPRHFRQHL
jgi:AraC family transcriptional regulator, melibiose operon regulatory protein